MLSPILPGVGGCPQFDKVARPSYADPQIFTQLPVQSISKKGRSLMRSSPWTLLFAVGLFCFGFAAAGPAGEEKTMDVVVLKDVMVPMRDGVELATDLYLPAKDGRPLEGKFPVVLQRTPYDKENQFYKGPGHLLCQSRLPVGDSGLPGAVPIGRRVLPHAGRGGGRLRHGGMAGPASLQQRQGRDLRGLLHGLGADPDGDAESAQPGHHDPPHRTEQRVLLQHARRRDPNSGPAEVAPAHGHHQLGGSGEPFHRRSHQADADLQGVSAVGLADPMATRSDTAERGPQVRGRRLQILLRQQRLHRVLAAARLGHGRILRQLSGHSHHVGHRMVRGLRPLHRGRLPGDAQARPPRPVSCGRPLDPRQLGSLQRGRQLRRQGGAHATQRSRIPRLRAAVVRSLAQGGRERRARPSGESVRDGRR